VWPEDVNKSPSWSSDDDVTEETREWVDSVFQLEDPVYDEYANIPDLAGLEVKAKIIDELKSSDGWSLDSVQGELARKFDLAMGDQQLQTIARTETAAVLNRSQMVALEALPDDPVVKWVGPDDSRTTDLCRDLSDETADGVPFSEFKSMMREYADSYPAGKTDRLDQGILHFQERHTVKREYTNDVSTRYRSPSSDRFDQTIVPHNRLIRIFACKLIVSTVTSACDERPDIYTAENKPLYC
jgi:hypothetical protein